MPRPHPFPLPFRRLAVAILVIAGLLAPVVVAPEPAAAGSRPRILLIGDSTLAALDWYPGTTQPLAGLDYTLRAASCRAVTATSCVGRRDSNGRRIRPDNALSVLRSYGSGAFDEVVVMAGYDESSTAFAGSLVEFPKAARELGVDHITWLTFTVDVDYVPPANDWSYRGNNRLLREAARTSGGFISLLDWNSHTASRSGLLEADGVHLTARGAESVARLIRDSVVNRWGSGAVRSSNSSNSSNSSTGSASSGRSNSSAGTSSTGTGSRMTLSYGVIGDPVDELQEILLRIGSPALKPYGVTGKFYAATRRAVRDFQELVQDDHDSSMVVDGIVGPVTWRWLDRLDPG